MAARSDFPIDEIAEDACNAVHSDGVVISLLLPETYIVLAGTSWPAEEYADASVVPVDLSICQHVIGMRSTLVIEDTLIHPLVRDNPLVRDAGVCAYLGAPIFIGHDASAAICGLNRKRRRWSKADVACMVHAAQEAAHALLPDVDGAIALPIVAPAGRA